MSEPTKVRVETEKDFVRRVIDLANVTYPTDEQIDGIEYDVLEALIWANKKLGSINSPAAEAFVRDYIGKPKFSRKLFTRYQKSLADKGWLLGEAGHYALIKNFDTGSHGCLFSEGGLRKVATISVSVVRD